MSDGKRLEALVSFVESQLLPLGFEVKTNHKIRNEDGIQIAEFDVEARGRVGSTDFSWLIECRDRPSQGPAPGAWIEQLVGRRARFGFNKVTAVSTTGFAAGAGQFAAREGIELREVRELSAEGFSEWMQVPFLLNHTRHTELRHVEFRSAPETSEEQRVALRDAIAGADGNSPLLKSSTTGDLVSAASAFCGVISNDPALSEDLVPNGDAKTLNILAQYSEEDHFLIETNAGPVRIEKILYIGAIRLTETKIPITYSVEYVKRDTGEAISQMVEFAPTSSDALDIALQFHRVADTGMTHVAVRKMSGGD